MRYFLFLCFCFSAALFAAFGTGFAQDKPEPPKRTESGEQTERRRPNGERRQLTPEQVQRYRSTRGRAKLPKDLFGEQRPESPSPSVTNLGGTVPAIWEIEQSSPVWDDADLPNVFERDTLAPPVPGKVFRYATALMQRYDTNADGTLQNEEWKKMPGAPQAIDINGDGNISLEEIVRFLADYGEYRTIHHPVPVPKYHQPAVASSQFQLFKPISPPAPEPLKGTKENKPAKPEEQGKDADKEEMPNIAEGELPDEDTPLDDKVYEEIIAGKQVPRGKKYYTPPSALRGCPPWFIVRDRDGDGQVSLLEFAPTLSPAALATFGKLDKNGDGFITPDEVRK
ncbi:MAG: hypothetical protein LBN39_10050 [Planctomycetaceae bacterium]|jgi:hypothetical protein|nr:hypothetical protein [Planctomycetaceae bacterium]